MFHSATLRAKAIYTICWNAGNGDSARYKGMQPEEIKYKLFLIGLNRTSTDLFYARRMNFKRSYKTRRTCDLFHIYTESVSECFSRGTKSTATVNDPHCTALYTATQRTPTSRVCSWQQHTQYFASWPSCRRRRVRC